MGSLAVIVSLTLSLLARSRKLPLFQVRVRLFASRYTYGGDDHGTPRANILIVQERP